MTRTNAREIACHLVYEMYLNDITAGEALTALMDEGYYPSLKSESDVYEEKPTGKQLEYLQNVVQGVQAKRAELEGYLEKYAIGWSVGRISKVARAVMEVAMYEVLYVHDVPTGAAISEAVEAATTTPGYRYVLGSVLNQVLLHQSVIGLEAKAALDKYNIVPDIIIGCAGGGSNLGGLISPFMGEKLRGEKDYRFIAVEPASCPSFTRGKFAYDFCDTGMVCPLAKMYTLGSNFIPSPNHAGGLRYHGMSSILSQLYHDGYMEAVSVEQTKVFEAAEQFARIEGILPAPESSHAIRVAIDEALKCKETGEAKTIVFGLTGTGYFDMVAYEKFHNGEMTDYIPTDAELEASFATLPKVPGQD